MKKVIVTSENYEEVMFNLLENQYSKEISENIFEQIHADTFLNFEWKQWSKATYSESTEFYKNNEAEFIENLTKEDTKKRGLLLYWMPISIAASIIFLLGVYNVIGPKVETIPSFVMDKKEIPSMELPKNFLSDSFQSIEKYKIAGSSKSSVLLIPSNPSQIDSIKNTIRYENKIAEVNLEPKTPIESQSFSDTIRKMISEAKRKSRFTYTVIESSADEIIPMQEVTSEKRYSMADVLNRKDGITLSKFLQNSTSRIINDKTTNKVSIEYVAADHSVLVLNLSN